MKEIIIDGVLYEAHIKQETLLNPQPGDYIVNTQPRHGYWLVSRVLFFIVENNKIALVAENSNGYLYTRDCTYNHFSKHHRIYNGEEGAHQTCYNWWAKKTKQEDLNILLKPAPPLCSECMTLHSHDEACVKRQKG